MARFIADHLGKEIVFKRASDILSKWVGETEQNIRDCFEEAASRRTRCWSSMRSDSLLGSRDRAVTFLGDQPGE